MATKTSTITPSPVAGMDEPQVSWWRRALTSPMGAQVAALIAFLALWVLLDRVSEKFPGPVAVVQAFYHDLIDGEFATSFTVSMRRFLIGMLLAVAIGMALGLLIGISRLMNDILGDLNLVGLAIPAVIWALLCIMWFGFGDTSPIVCVVLSGVPFVAVNVAAGVRAVPPQLRQMSSSYGVSRLRGVRHVILPAVFGYVFAGIRFAFISGWNGLLLSEWFGASEGVGFRARYWYDATQWDGFLAWIAFFILFMLIIDRGVLETISRRVFRWRDTDKTAALKAKTRAAAT
jgi:ABC-type nitrate/sulfonate/bicarbonate transport system permease component